MSLESGRKLGITASLIAVITPVIIVVVYVFSFLLLFASVLVRTNSTAPPSPIPNLMIILFSVIGIVGFAGVILFFIAMLRLSRYYNEPGIFKNTLYGFIVSIVGSIISAVFYVVLLGSLISSISHSNIQTAAVTPIPTVPPIATSFVTFILLFLVFLGVALILAVTSAVFYMRAFNKLGEKSGVNNFKTAGLLYLLGAVLSVVGIGALLLWIAWIFALMGFRSLKPKTAETPFWYSASPLTPSTGQRKYCSYCGTENNLDALYCRSCGRKLQ